MKNLFNKLFAKKKKQNYRNLQFSRLQKSVGVKKIFDSFQKNLEKCEIRFVGGCIRKILNNEDFDDIDLATDITPSKVQEILESNNISYYNTGADHGTITANINNEKFEITSLRKDVLTDGRHAKVEFTKDWSKDSLRRDFTINCIYSDISGNLYDPFNGKFDLKNGIIKFIGDADKRIKEDYLRILRYIRFYLDYSKHEHEVSVKKIILKNIHGIKKISKERLLDELKKILQTKNFTNIIEDKFSSEIINLIFPELNKLISLKSIRDHSKDILSKNDFIFRLSLFIVDGKENAEYFVFKYNISNKDKQRIIFLNRHYNLLNDKNFFTEKNLLKIYYFNGISSVYDLINFKIFISKKLSKNLVLLKNNFSKIPRPELPIKAKNLIEKFGLKEGKDLGDKIKEIENLWIQNNFNISESDIKKISTN